MIYLILTVLGSGISLLSFAGEDNRLSEAASLVQTADSLRMRYRFEESLAVYGKAMDTLGAADSSFRLAIHDKVLMSENGRSMTGFVDEPSVLSRRRFSLDDFFMYYPVRDSSWHPVPNRLDSSGSHRIVRGMFIRDEDRVRYWSSEDAEGIRNIYTSSLRDSVWTLPALLNEQMMSASDEIFPMLSPDGKSLFFASEGLHGVGGYDIYVSHWNEDSGDWEAPVNMGFPYSSPADDFLYVDTEDGRYSIFASNRDCPADSVWVYVLEFDNIPVRKAVHDPAELMEIARLEPVAEKNAGDSGIDSDVSVNPRVQDYMYRMKSVASLKDSVSHYVALAAEGRVVPHLQNLQDSLARSRSELQRIEMELMLEGVALDPEKLMEEAGQEVLEEPEFVFRKMNPGGSLNMVFEVPEVRFDYSFKVLDQAQFAEDQSVPAGIVYQIQMFASKRKASLKSLKGLSPVYEVAGANGHIVYRVGLFRTYSDVLSNLNTVKKLGFRSAFIVAYVDGKSVTVAKAREKEKSVQKKQEFYEVRIEPDGGELDAGVAAGVRQQSAGKDIARVVKTDGTVVFVVGPFADKAKAEELAVFVKAMGVKEASCGVIRK